MKNWIEDAAAEIFSFADRPGSVTEGEIYEIVARRCPIEVGKTYMPVERGVSYMPVPKCSRCKHWDREDVTSEGTAECRLESMRAEIHTVNVSGVATRIDFRMRTKADFGCVRWEAK